MKSSGDPFGCEAAAQMIALFNKVFLFGVPRCRPPRRSPGFDPLGICYFANFLRAAERTGIHEGLTNSAAVARVSELPQQI